MGGASDGGTVPEGIFAMKLLALVPPADRKAVQAAARVAAYGPGEAVYRQGAVSTSLALVLEGRVKLCVPSAHGRELVVSLIEPGQSFGEIGFLDGRPRSLDAVAILPSRVLSVRRATLLAIMARTPPLALAFAGATCKRLRRTTEAVQQAVFYGVEERLADCILHLAAAAPSTGPAAPTITLWQHDLAAMLGVTRESINKHLRAWQARRLVRLSRGRIALLDTAELSRIAAMRDAAAEQPRV